MLKTTLIAVCATLAASVTLPSQDRQLRPRPGNQQARSVTTNRIPPPDSQVRRSTGQRETSQVSRRRDASRRGYGRPVSRSSGRGYDRDRSGRNHSRGHYETVTRRVWIEGQTRRIWVPAEFGFRYDSCGNRVRFVIHRGHYRSVCDPGYWDYRTERVWVPGRSYRHRH